MNKKWRLSIALLTTMIAPQAMAQNAIYSPSVEARVRTLLDRRTTLPRGTSGTHSASEVSAYRAIEKQILDRLMALPAVNAPASGVCTEVATWADMGGTDMMPILGGEVRAMLPVVTDGKCTKLEGAGVILRLNDFRALGETVPDTFRIKGDLRFVSPGMIEMGSQESGQKLILHRREVFPVAPMLARDFLTASIAEAHQQLAKLSGDGFGMRKVLEDQISAREADRAKASPSQQACVQLGTADQELDLSEECVKENRLWSVDRGYFNKAGSGAVRLIVATTDPAPQSQESPANMAARLAIWSALDRDWLQSLAQ